MVQIIKDNEIKFGQLLMVGIPGLQVDDVARHMVRELNVGHLMVLLHFGNLSKEQTLRNTELYAREVMPHLRGLWSDWVDHWYPKPPHEPERPSEPVRLAATQA